MINTLLLAQLNQSLDSCSCSDDVLLDSSEPGCREAGGPGQGGQVVTCQQPQGLHLLYHAGQQLL